MEGPTPVSALIHAATMVAAGVYMLCRILFLLNADALHVIAYIGGFTALLAALIAVQQNDIKRIIAYSTLSQLGYMVMAVGLAGPTAAMFHLTTHAFFKALLFLERRLGHHALHHEQDIWKMGDLRKKMPVTFWTFLVGALALSGVWPIQRIFQQGQHPRASPRRSIIICSFAIGVFIAGLTTFYIFRLFFVVFFGRGKSEAGFARARIARRDDLAADGARRIQRHRRRHRRSTELTTRMFAGEAEKSTGFAQTLIEPFVQAPLAASLGILAVIVGFFAAFALYAKADKDPLPEKLGGLATAMKNKFYFDELYEATFIRAA